MEDEVIITKDPVCVTGASGFIATHIIQQLLAKGYKVRGTVRSVKDLSKYEYLTRLDPSGDQLQLVEADLVAEGSYDNAVAGCEYVLHTASPFVLNVKDPQQDLVDPAVNGTKNVLNACLKSGTVKKVVLTSSVAALTDSPSPDHVYTEADWNDTSSLSRNPYYYSKKLAEEAAWRFVNEEHKGCFKLVVLNPFLVIGPHLAKQVGESSQGLQRMMSGEMPGIMDLHWCYVDARDVAKAHILLMERADAKGRHICTNPGLTMTEVAQLLNENYPNYPIPTANLACSAGNVLVKLASYMEDKGTGQYLRTNVGRKFDVDTSKLTNMGFTYIPAKQSILDTVEDLLANGHIPEPKKKKKSSKKDK